MAKKILVVDDEPSLVMMVESRLKANRYGVIIANNGIECLEKAQTEKPDLILLDIMMPEMDGFQTLEKLRENNQTKSIPVIMLTAKSQLDDVNKAANLGVTDYIVKPFSPVVFLEKIHKALK